MRIRDGLRVASLSAAALALTLSADAAATQPVDLQAAIDRARPGDTLEIPSGTYRGPIVVDKPLTLAGIGMPVIDGGNDGTVVTLASPGIVFRGFEVRHSGIDPNRNDAGIAVQAPRITVEANRLREVLVGVLVTEADQAIIHGNDITGIAAFDQGRKGDGIRLWYSHNVTVEDNRVHDVRDIVIWYSARPHVLGNTISDSRYGIHLMYGDDARIEANRVLDNSVGVYVMYSDGTRLIDNLIRGQRGPSGYGMGFKDSDDILAAGNVLADDRVGIFLDGTPFAEPGSTLFEDNVLAFNDIGVLLQPSVRTNRFHANTFWENTDQVAFHGGGMGENAWEGNAWSDYAGFDADQDGVGDLPYEPQRVFGRLTDTEPRLQMILHSPVAQAIEFAGAAFPIVRPESKLVDVAPRTLVAELPEFAAPEPAARAPLLLAGLLLAGIGVAGGGLAYLQRGPNSAEVATAPRVDPAQSVLRLTGIRKTFGRAVALDGISLEAAAGEALALWGPNGAGKTTLLNAILGLMEYQGDIRVLGFDPRTAGKPARALIGYVPQAMTFYDANVAETLRFFARLRGADPERATGLLEQMGLSPHAGKAVAALSGGMRQRLALAVALVGDPPLLLLDEPTANLDVRARREHIAVLAGLRQEGRTLIFATHRLEEIDALADRIAVLDHGRLVDILQPAEFRQRFAPEIEMTIRVDPESVSAAFRSLEAAGLAPRLNGQNSLVLSVRADRKVEPLDTLHHAGVALIDFTIEETRGWS